MSELPVLWFLVFFGLTSGQVTHPKAWIVARRGRAARIDCEVDSSLSLSTNPLHWYRQIEGEPITRLLHFPAGSNAAQKDDIAKGAKFTAVKKGQKSTLTISSSNEKDDGVYYCAVWSSEGDRKIFGSGTRLYVTDQSLRAPSVAVYSTFKREEQNTLLCRASGMYPDLVRFQWKKKNGETWANTATGDGEVLELKDSDKSMTSMMIINPKTEPTNFGCSVAHEAKNQGRETDPVPIKKKDSEGQPPEPVASAEPTVSSTCAPGNNTNSPTTDAGTEAVREEVRSLYLAMWVYTLMIVKGMAYFCAISFFLCRKHMGSKAFTIGKLSDTMDMKMSK